MRKRITNRSRPFFVLLVLTILSATTSHAEKTQKHEKVETKEELAITNQIEKIRQHKDTKSRILEFRAQLGVSQDPVALAVEMSNDTNEYCMAETLPVFAKHWEDPRSEKALEALLNRGPDVIADGIITVHGRASGVLSEVKAKKVYRQLLNGKETPVEQLAAIKEYCKEHPDVFSGHGEKYELKVLFADFLMEHGGKEEIETVLRTGRFTTGYVKKYLPEIISYARELGPEKARKIYRFQDELTKTGDKRVIPLLEEWLTVTKRGYDRRSLERSIKKLRNQSD